MDKCNGTTENLDVIIVGTGAAGLFCALKLPENLNVQMITKDKTENSDSYLAQGGIAALRNAEDFEDYFEDTLKSGHYINSKESVKVMIESSSQIICELLAYGVDFERNSQGFIYTKEGGHSQARILHHKDITGQEITSKLLLNLKKRKNVKIDEYTTMIDIICENNICKGVVVEKNHKIYMLYAKIVIFATGGIGGLFHHSTNFKHITGDALAIAIKHQIELQDMNYIQIHPTSFYSKADISRSFLISESVRGEGAILLNENMERFVDELQPRDVVSAAIKKQMDLHKKEYVYLSLKHVDQDKIKERFPTIYQHCLEEGYDLTSQYIPVTPAQHYFMGGIKVNLCGETSMKNLFAIGETSCNGVHGRNRLGSNSLLESLVFSERAANKIAESIDYIEQEYADIDLRPYYNRNFQVEYKNIIFNEIKERDHEFYEQWCSNES